MRTKDERSVQPPLHTENNRITEGGTVNGVLGNTLASVKIQERISQGPLHLYPLTGGPDAEKGIALLEEALRRGALRIDEIGEGGSVPELRVVNGGPLPVLFLEGDELIGAKQNRVVNSSVLVAPESELVLPVSCVERGRWSYRSRSFGSGDGTPHLSLRRLKSRSVHESLKRGRGHRSDQGAVWSEIDRKAYLHEASAPTEALQDARASVSERLEPFWRLAERMPEGTRGVVVALGKEVLLTEVLAGPRSFSKAFAKRLSGYAFEALERGNEGAPIPRVVEEFVVKMASAEDQEYPAVGAGRDIRFEADGFSGYALVGEGGLLHAAAFAA